MKGQVYKIHSDFYYVKTAEGSFEAKLKDVLKKQDLAVYVGDFVEVEEGKTQGFITKLFERKNFIPKPKAANVEQVIIVSSVKEPLLDFEQLDRYIALCEYYKIRPILCFSKNDLNDDSNLHTKVYKIYGTLGYEIIFISALENNGMDALKEILKNKVSVLCGLSGVGKTTLLNILHPDFALRTGDVHKKTQRGTHTTRHCEMLHVDFDGNDYCKIIDTPGFSRLKFDFLQPEEISDLFVEMRGLKKYCKYKDCLHINESDCFVIKNLDKIANSRYDSYLKFVEEAREYKKFYQTASLKVETKSKNLNNSIKVKISSRKREFTRRKVKQSLDNIEGFNDN